MDEQHGPQQKTTMDKQHGPQQKTIQRLRRGRTQNNKILNFKEKQMRNKNCQHWAHKKQNEDKQCTKHNTKN